MTVSVDLPAETANRLLEEAARRGLTVEQVATELLSEALAHRPQPGADGATRRRLGFAAIGASGGTRGAADAEELLAEGFGRD